MRIPPKIESRKLHVSLRGQADTDVECEMERRMPVSEEEATMVRLKETQEHLERIRKQHEDINRLREHLETRQYKQTQFATSRREWMEKLNRSLMGLDREILDAEKLLDQLQAARDSFARHATVLRSFHPENWHEDEIQEQLERALAAVDEASAEHQKLHSRLQTLRQAFTSGTPEVSGVTALMSGSTREIVRAGLAFTAPLMICLAILLFLSLMFQ